ncbi:MAG: Holliday junction branch migration protein RuvA [Patescibacteria group bacterium]
MIARLTGSVVRTHLNPLVLDVHGVGYAVYVPQKLLTTLTINRSLTVYTHTHVREDALLLFGFATEEELTIFELLLTVSGIGPKTALLVLERGVAAIRRSIVSSDVEFFMAVPRLGKKNAQKIIIELKSKVGSTSDLDLSGEDGGDTKEIIDALISMGFDRKEAREATKKLPAEGSLKEKIKFALKMLG